MRHTPYLFAILVLSACSHVPDKEYCNGAWDFYDESHGTSRNVIDPDSGIFRDRECLELSKKEFEVIDDFSTFFGQNRSRFMSWTEAERVRQSDPEWHAKMEAKSTTQQQGYLYVNQEHAINDLAEIDLESNSFKLLSTKLEALPRKAQYLIPMRYTKAKKWLSLDTPKKTKAHKESIQSAMKKNREEELAKKQGNVKYKKELAAFLSSAYTRYNLTSAEFQYLVVRGDMVDDWGLSLGETLFRLENSRSIKVKDHKITNNKVKMLVVTTESRAQDTEVIFNFYLSRYAILKSIEIEDKELSGAKATAALQMFVQ